MEAFTIYKDMDVTYKEFRKALSQLGFKKVSDENRFYYLNPEFGSAVLLPLPKKSEDENIVKAFFASYSFALSEQGIIRHPDDLAKLIEQNRLNNAEGKRIISKGQA